MLYKNPKSKRKNVFRKIYDNGNYLSVLEKREKPAEFPFLVDVELTNKCNLACLFCGQQAMTRKRGFMNEKIFKQIVKECAKYKAAIRFIRWGEPFLHPKIFDFISFAKKEKIIVHVTTNGLLLDESKIKRIIRLELDSLIFSFQGATKEEYGKMRNNPFYEKLKNNVFKIVKIRGTKAKPYIHISCTVTNEPKYQIEKFIKYWGNLVDSVEIGKTNLSRFTPAQIKKFETIGKLEELKEQERIKKEYRPCSEVYHKLSVNFDGTVSACCSDYDNYLLVGDLKKESLYEIWHKSKKLKMYRYLLDKGDFRSLTLCSSCYFSYDNF